MSFVRALLNLLQNKQIEILLGVVFLYRCRIMELLKQYKITNQCLKCPGLLTPGSIGDLTVMHF